MSRALLSLCSLMLVMGCAQKDPAPVGGSGGSGGTGGAAGTAGSGGTAGTAGTGGGGTGGSTADYYPLVEGASWTYLHTNADQTMRTEVVTLTATTHEGQAGFLMVDSGNAAGQHDESVLVRSGTSIVRIYSETLAGQALLFSVTYENPGFVRFDDAWHDRAAGFSEDRTYTRTEYDAQGLNPVVDPRTQRFIVEAHGETLTVPAGTFNDVIRVRRDRVGFTNDSNKQFWFAPGVGKIRELDLLSGDIEELTAYTIPGG
jgi:hypothetical protein